MAGNAIPPLFTFAVGLALDGRSFPETLPSFHALGGIAPDAPRERSERRPAKAGRTFRAAIRQLRFKSAMAFELRNTSGRWEIVFHTGGVGSRVLSAEMMAAVEHAFWPPLKGIDFRPEETSEAWDASRDCADHPFRVADALGRLASDITLDKAGADYMVQDAYRMCGLEPSGKALANAARIAAGLLVATWFNGNALERRIAA